MYDVRDIAADILSKNGPMTAMKLQKLVYYAQAWSLVWDERALFADEIQAWANGPVCPALYECHRGQFEVRPADIIGDPARLDATAHETIDAVLRYYGEKPAPELSELTHRESPWLDARAGLHAGERGNRPITHAAMAEYYGGLS